MAKLQSEKNTFIWTHEHEEEFKKIKDELCSEKYIFAFHPDLPIELYTEISHLGGLGYALIQRAGGNNRRIIKCGSTSLTDSQRRWSMVELELASDVYRIEKCKMYTTGASDIAIYNDQQALVNLQHKNLADIPNARIVRRWDRISAYDFQIFYIQRELNYVSDTLSRA